MPFCYKQLRKIMRFMEKIDAIIQAIGSAGVDILLFNIIFFIPGQKIEFLIALITLASLIFTVWLKFPNIRCIFSGIKLLHNKKYESTNETNAITSNKAFWSTLSGIVGVGNITGMSAAVYIGGPGTVFWILAYGFITMPLRYAEVFFGHKLRVVENGEIKACGPFAYIGYTASQIKNNFFRTLLVKFFPFGLILASFGAIAFQANPIVNSIAGANTTEMTKIMIALVIALGTLYVITGGLQRIVGITAKLGLYMSALYIISVIAIIGVHWKSIPSAFHLIMHEAFNTRSAYGGLITIMFFSFRRAVIASEIGFGTGALLHGMSQRKSSSDEAKVGMLAPFFGSLIFCSLNGLMLVVAGAHSVGDGGTETMRATFMTLHPFMNYVLIVIILMFGLSTIIVWFYYAQSAFQKLTGSDACAKFLPYIYSSLVFITGLTTFRTLLTVVDLLTLVIVIPNIFSLFYLSFHFTKRREKLI